MSQSLEPPVEQSLTAVLTTSTELSSYAPSKKLKAVQATLAEAFDEAFTIVNVVSGELVYSEVESLGCDLYGVIELLAQVHRIGKPEIVQEVAPLTMLAIPISDLGIGEDLVAIGIFATCRCEEEQAYAAAAEAFGVDARRLSRWARQRSIWPSHLLLKLATSVYENLVRRQQVVRLEAEAAEANAHSEDTYAELDLLHRLTSQLSIAENETELWTSALSWLSDTVHAQCLSIVFRGNVEKTLIDDDCSSWEVHKHGEAPTSDAELCELLRRFGRPVLRRPILLNRAETTLPTWHCPTIRELACVPIEGTNEPRGWLVALNHRGTEQNRFNEFGSIEIQLLRSVGTILGIHNSNLSLYRDQSQLFASAVQALTSAIDAKDRYTAGHSNRVAYFSVALAEQLGLDKADRDTIYLAGLLHDIGKIGVDDQVLNKPGQLTAEEFAQIKLHPELGYEILKGVRQLDRVLPIVLHHHEAWDGSGYPYGLKENETPLMARIMAVADAYDAMSSDRPYRKGMPHKKLDQVLREGAGTQWDPDVVNAYFTVRDEFRRIVEASKITTSTIDDSDVEYAS